MYAFRTCVYWIRKWTHQFHSKQHLSWCSKRKRQEALHRNFSNFYRLLKQSTFLICQMILHDANISNSQRVLSEQLCKREMPAVLKDLLSYSIATADISADDLYAYTGVSSGFLSSVQSAFADVCWLNQANLIGFSASEISILVRMAYGTWTPRSFTTSTK